MEKFLVAFLICFGASFFSIDTAIAGSPFKQGGTMYNSSKKNHDIKKGRGKKTHLRKKKRNIKQELIITWDMDMGRTLGFAPMHRNDETLSPFDLINTTILNRTKTANTGTLVTTNRSSNTPERKLPNKKAPGSNTAFILPSILAVRKQFTKKKKA